MATFRASSFLVLALLAVLLATSDGCPRRRRRIRTTPRPPVTKPPSQTCCLGKPATRDEPSEYGNKGTGPAEHSASTVCYYYKTSNCMVCQSPRFSKTAHCCTKGITGDDVSIIPANEYLIGYERGVYQLYPLKVDGNSYFAFHEHDANGQSGWSIHSEGSSSGKKGVTVLDTCWSDIRDAINEGSLTYLGIQLRGFLYVKNE